MKTIAALSAAGVLALSGFAAPVKVIFDTDMIGDFDDVGALACLHALADAGECEILATISSTRGNASVGAIEVINHYYGRPDLPVGSPKGMGVMGDRAGAKEKVCPSAPLKDEKPGEIPRRPVRLANEGMWNEALKANRLGQVRVANHPAE